MAFLFLGGLGLSLFLLVGYTLAVGESAPVTNVVLADNDIIGSGLDGRDFTVTWSPTSSQPAGYQYTQIFITTSGVQLTTTNISTNGCGGSAPQMRGMFMQFTGMTTFTLPNFPNTDSCNQSYATSTSYVAWIYTAATASSIASSTAVSYANAFDVVADINAPQIMHSGAHGAKESSAAFLYATVFDDQTIGEQFANTSDGGAEYFKLFYRKKCLYRYPSGSLMIAFLTSQKKFTCSSCSCTAP